MAEVLVVDKPARRYRSPQREEQARQTRDRILHAATAQFLALGYTAATMRAIATTAGVSVPTIELVFGSKPQLLKEAIDVAIAGDDEPIAVLQREWVSAAQEATDVAAFLAVVGDVVRRAEVRSSGLVVAAFEAAASNPDLEALVRQLSRQRSGTVAWILDGLVARAPLRDGLSRGEAIDTLWLLMDPIVFQRLTRDRGWSAARYERWFTDSVERLLLATPIDVAAGSPGPTRTARQRKGQPA